MVNNRHIKCITDITKYNYVAQLDEKKMHAHKHLALFINTSFKLGSK